jgi:CAAX protease family protein
MNGTVLHLVGAVAAIAIVLVVCRVRRWPLRETLALRLPAWRQVAIWVPAFVALFLAEEAAYTALGLGEGTAWGDRFTLPWVVLRVIGMVVLAPVAEEMVFRGLLFKRIRDTRLGPLGAIVVTGVFFAALHFQYTPVEAAFILVDGLFLGVVRYSSDSLLLPVLFHSAGNLYAAVERITGRGIFQ